MAQSRKARREPAQPILMTEEEIQAKVAGGKAAAAVTARLRGAVPTKALGRLKTKAQRPVPVSRNEMKAVKRAGMPSETLTKRLAKSAPVKEPPTRVKRERRSEPARAPGEPRTK